MTKQASSDPLWQERAEFLQNAIRHTTPSTPSLWDVIATYMRLRDTGNTEMLKHIEQYLNTLPGINLEKLELMLKEPANQHGYLAASLPSKQG